MIYKTVKCAFCNKEIHVLEQYARKTMFCTLACLEQNKTQDNYVKRQEAIIAQVH
jgi:hypothetical protein